jgi:hypothetical protein
MNSYKFVDIWLFAVLCPSAIAFLFWAISMRVKIAKRAGIGFLSSQSKYISDKEKKQGKIVGAFIVFVGVVHVIADLIDKNK